MKQNNLEKSELFELKIYEKLGVLTFRKLVFLLEKIIHFKDKGQNENYHFKSKKPQDFMKYIYYNGSIHVRGAIRFLILFPLLNIVINPLLQNLFYVNKWSIVLSQINNVVLILLFIKDEYCIMLQRYNQIKISDAIRADEKHKDRRIEKGQKVIEKELSNNEKLVINLDINLNVVNKLKNYSLDHEDVIFGNDSLGDLRKIKEFLLIYKEIKNNKKSELTDEKVKALGERQCN